MKIADRTPFRNENGQIDIWGRVQGTLKFGIGWSARLEAQDSVIGVLDKILGSNFILLRNITLPDTEIDLPLVLIDPPGIYLINITPERGVYRARDDEWGTVIGEKFVPAPINQVQRTVKLGRVLQIYLDRAGYKGAVVVDPILMAADPGMHIESVRPAARIVMSDALERFAISMNQARAIFTSKMIIEIARVIVNGPKEKSENDSSPMVMPTPVIQQLDGEQPLQDSEPDESPVFTSDPFGFSFDEPNRETTPQQNVFDEQQTTTGSQPESDKHTSAFVGYDESLDSLQEAGSQFRDADETEPTQDAVEISDRDRTNEYAPSMADGIDNAENQPGDANQPTASSAKKKGIFGMTNRQILILAVIILFWLCSMIAFAVYVYFNLNV